MAQQVSTKQCITLQPLPRAYQSKTIINANISAKRMAGQTEQAETTEG